MPELPEVATVVRYLNKNIDNSQIKDVIIVREKFLKNITANEFIQNVKNETINNVERYGKNIIFSLSNDKYFVSHLRMEGRWYVVDDKFDLSNKHIHLIFKLDNQKTLCYVDTRQFGTIFYYSSHDLMMNELHSKTGLDSLDPACNGEYLYHCFSKTKLPIKAALLDQSKVMGIGNIYANEICFAMNINPEMPFCNLDKERYDELATILKNMMKSAIMQNGTTVHSFEFGLNKTGEFQNELVVYNHAQKPCQVCNTPINKIEIKQRGTYYCPKCQENVKN